MLKLAICEDDVIQCEQIQCLTQSSLRIPFEFDIFSSAKGFLKQISNKKCPYQIDSHGILSSALNPCQELTLQKKSIPQIQTRRLFLSASI